MYCTHNKQFKQQTTKKCCCNVLTQVFIVFKMQGTRSVTPDSSQFLRSYGCILRIALIHSHSCNHWIMFAH